MALSRMFARRQRPTGPCPCCGHRTLTGEPGDYELCPVCFWEDDPTQLRRPDLTSGANGVALVDAQQAYLRLGAMGVRFASRVRAPAAGKPVDDGWRVIDRSQDSFEPTRIELGTWAEFRRGPYWWSSDFWRRSPV